MRPFKGVGTMITDLNAGKVCVHYIYDETFEDYEIISIEYKGVNITEVVSDADHAQLVEEIYNKENNG